MRVYDVKMSGTNWKPEIPSLEKLESELNEIKNIKCDTERIIKLMSKLMKMQLFNDGNKRTAMLIANHELIKLGRGIISISEENKVGFGTMLIKYYENEDELENLVNFVYEKCLDGIVN